MPSCAPHAHGTISMPPIFKILPLVLPPAQDPRRCQNSRRSNNSQVYKPASLRQTPLPCFDSTCRHTWQPQIGHAKGYHATTMSHGPVLVVPVLVPTSCVCTHAHIRCNCNMCHRTNQSPFHHASSECTLRPSRFYAMLERRHPFLIPMAWLASRTATSPYLRPHEFIYSNIAPLKLKPAISGLVRTSPIMDPGPPAPTR